MQIKKSIVLVFAGSPSRDARRKGMHDGVELFKELNSHAVNEVKKSGLDYVIYTEDLQEGRNLSERLLNAVLETFVNGYEQIIIIGSDTPHLTSTHLLTAHHNLCTGELTIGPSNDGGIYLMAFNKRHFMNSSSLQCFTDLRWQSSKLGSQLITWFLQADECELHILSKLQDIDSVQDVKSLNKAGGELPVQLMLLLHLLLIDYSQKSDRELTLRIPTFMLSVQTSRGSPF
jgi:hypothetical protein